MKRVWNSWTLIDSPDVWAVDSQSGCLSCSRDQPHLPAAPPRHRLTIFRTSTRPEGLLQSIATSPRDPSLDPSRARRERVERIRIAIADGSYHISSSDLAQKLIERIVRHPR